MVRRLFILLGFSLILLLSACGSIFNGRGGMPGYLQYVKGSVNLKALGLPEIDPTSSIDFRMVRPDAYLQADNIAFPPGAAGAYLVLSYKSGTLNPSRALIFDKDLNFLYDTRDKDSLLGYYSNWIQGARTWQFQEQGQLILGANSLNMAADPSNPPDLVTDKSDWESTFFDYRDAANWRDILVRLETVNDIATVSSYDGSNDDIYIRILFTRDRVAARLPATGYFGAANDPAFQLMNDANVTVTNALTASNRTDLIPESGNYEFFLTQVFPDFYNDRIIHVISARDAYNESFNLFYILVITPYNPANVYYGTLASTPLPSNANDYLFAIIPATAKTAKDRTAVNFDGTYFYVLNGERRYWDNGDPMADASLDIYKLSGSGELAPAGTTMVSQVASIPYDDLFLGLEHDRDFALTLYDSEGSWYLYDRESQTIYTLGIGAGGWQ